MPEVYAIDLDNELLFHLADPESWQVLRAEGFKEDLIVDEWALKVYRWQRNHVREYGKPATASVLEDEFPDLEMQDPETTMGDLIHRLRMRYIKNEVRDRLKGVADVFNDEPAAIGKELLRYGREITKIVTPKGESFGTGDWDRALDRYMVRANQKTGPSLGFPELDSYFTYQRGLTMLIAPPKTFKSWFMVKVALENVAAGKFPYLYSLELPAEETDMRLRCLAANVPWNRYVESNLKREEREYLGRLSEELDGQGMYEINKPPQGERTLDDLVERAKDAGADCVLIDQLQYVEINGRSLGAWNETGYYFDVLDHARNLSDEIPIMIAHQFNRSVMRIKEGERPSVQQAKGSSAIEETATLCLGLWSTRKHRGENAIEIDTLSARNAEYSRWEVKYNMHSGCDFKIEQKLPLIEDEE